MKYSLYIILLLAGFCSGCNKPDDDPAPAVPGADGPVITVTEKSVPAVTASLCGVSYDNVLKIAVGATLQMKMRFQSNRELSQYKIDIHSNFDCHTHARVAAASNPWKLSETVDISGTDTTVTKSLAVPADAAAGNYHFMIRLLDATGNEAEFVEYNIILFNPDDTEPPVISMVAPAQDSIASEAGSTLNIESLITDNKSLDNGKYELTYTDANGREYKLEQQSFPAGTAATYLLKTGYVIPAYAAKGTATFYIKAYDAVNNAGVKTFKVFIL
jgi:hypothetical protein